MHESHPSGYRTRNIWIKVAGSQKLTDYLDMATTNPKFQTGKTGDILQLKHEKQLKPVSLRVRDAAEFLLTSLVEQVGNFPSPTGTDSLSCLLNEEDLFQKSCLPKNDSNKSPMSAAQHFRYFAASEGTILLGVLEQSPNKKSGSNSNFFLLIPALKHA